MASHSPNQAMVESSTSELENQPAKVSDGVRWVCFTIIAYVLLLLSQAPLTFLYFKELWTRPHYQFFPFAFLAVAVLLYKRWPRSAGSQLRKSFWSSFLLIAGVVLAVGATLFVSPWLAAIASITFFSSCLARFRDTTTGGSLIALGVPLLTLIKPPVIGDTWIITKLQQVSSAITSRLLDLMGYAHNLAGNTLHLGENSYNVEEACSGIQSFYTILFCATLLAVYFHRTFFLSLVLLASAACWAILLNSFRILSICVAQERYNVDLLSGWQHDAIGYVALAIGLLLLLSTDSLIRFTLGSSDFLADLAVRERIADAFRWIFRLPFGSASDVRKKKRKGEVPAPNRRFIFALLLPSTLVMIVAFFFQAVDFQRAIAAPDHQVRFFEVNVTLPLDEDSVPSEVGDWKLVKHESVERTRGSDLGEYSDVWRYEAPQYQAVVQLDQPFAGWHELSVCYESAGWKMISREVIEADSGTGESWPYVRAKFKSPAGGYGYLIFSHFDINGDPYQPPEDWGGIESIMIRLQNRMAHSFRKRLFRSEAYQSQIWLQSYTPLPESIEEEVDSNYLVLRESMREEFASGELTTRDEE